MRAIWSGTVAFGLVSVPVRLYGATESHDLPLHQVHDKDGGRIRYQRRCEKCGKVVPFEHIDKAYDDGEHTVVLDDEDLASLPAERSKEIEVVEFVPDDQVDPMRYERSYYLEPDERSRKAYELLRRTLEAEARTAIVTVTLRQRSRLAALRSHGELLVLQTLLWDDELRRPSFDVLDDPVRISRKELDLAKVVVDSLKDDFSPADFTDEYEAELKALVEAKLAKGDTLPSPEPAASTKEPAGGEVVDLMDALRRSVERSRDQGSTKKTTKKTQPNAKKPSAKKRAVSEDAAG